MASGRRVPFSVRPDLQVKLQWIENWTLCVVIKVVKPVIIRYNN